MLSSNLSQPRVHHGPRGASRKDAGLTLLEVMIALVVLALSTVTALGLMVGSMRLDSTNRDTSRAVAAARSVVETMHGQDFREIFALYNDNPEDDPPGAVAPGSTFAVGGLTAEANAVGTVRFPIAPNGELREDLDMPELGLPMDLNGDGVIDDEDHSQDYTVLPVIVELRWVGGSGARELSVHALLMEQGS